MSRNLVVCMDGTNNEFGVHNTNVVRLYQALKDDPATQRRYYDPGVGTIGHPGAITSMVKKTTKLFGMAFGLGATQNILEGYFFLMREYREGDRIWIFGFSRGALQARALAALLYRSGLLKPELESLAPYAVSVSRSVSRKWNEEKRKQQQGEFNRVAAEFRRTFSREVKIHFLGLWDTVTSMGSIWSPKAWPYTTNNPSVVHVRHAIALDERRTFFRQNRWSFGRDYPAGQSVKEVWFAGVHSDVGGGYDSRESELWTSTMEWMKKEMEECAKGASLQFDDAALNAEIEASRKGCEKPEDSTLHDSMKSPPVLWYVAEVVPKPRRVEDSRHVYHTQVMWPVWHWFVPWITGRGKMGRARSIGRARTLQPGEHVHRSALERFVKDAKYRPEPLLKIGMTEEKAKEFVAGEAEYYKVPGADKPGRAPEPTPGPDTPPLA